MVALSTMRLDMLPVTVKNTFIDVVDVERVTPKHVVRSSSLPPSLNRSPSESTTIEEAGSDCFCLETDVTTSESRSRCEESEDLSFPDTDDEYEQECEPGRQVAEYRPSLVMLCSNVSTSRDETVVALEPAGDGADKGSNSVEKGSRRALLFASQAPAAPQLQSLHTHAISIKNVMVDAEEAPQAPAETSFRVVCRGEGERITVERMVKRSRLNRQAQAWPQPAAHGGGALVAAPARTKLSSKAPAWNPAAGGSAPAPAADVEPLRKKAPVPPAPSTSLVAPKFGFALLQYVKDILQKNVFVAGVYFSASAKGGWLLQIHVRRQDMYLKDHVLACAQEAMFGGLDALEAIRSRESGSRFVLPGTIFDLKVECSDPS